MSINLIVFIVIALLILAVLLFIFNDNISAFRDGTNSCQTSPNNNPTTDARICSLTACGDESGRAKDHPIQYFAGFCDDKLPDGNPAYCCAKLP